MAFLSELTEQPGAARSVAYSDVCFEPAKPYAPGCLTYDPLAWWDGSLEELAADSDIWTTLRKQSARGGVRGLSVQRSDVLAVVEGRDGVEEVQALMLWLFVDVAPGRATPAYLARAAAYESALLGACSSARGNSSLPFEALASISSSVQSEIQTSAAADVSVVVLTVGALFVWHFVILCAMDSDRVALHAVSASTTGLTLVGVFGWLRVAAWADVITAYPIQAMMIFLPLTMGLHQRAMLSSQCRSVLSGAEKGADHGRLLEVVATGVIAPAACSAAAVSGAMLYGAAWVVTVPAIRGCAVVAAGGVLLDFALLATVFMPALAIWQERKLTVGPHCSDDKQPEGDDDARARARSILQRARARSGLGQGIEGDGPHTSLLLPAHAVQARVVPRRRLRSCPPTATQLRHWAFSSCRAAAVAVTMGAIVFSSRYVEAYWSGGSAGSAVLHPDVTTQSLVPHTSEIKLWADAYAVHFASAISLPLNFPIDAAAEALMDPQNGPAMVAAVAALRANPRLNASSVTDWYGDFRAWCHKTYDGLHLCRNTMTAGSAAGEAGFLTPRSFEGYLSLFIAGNQQVGPQAWTARVGA
jgi:hypothetical protein